MLRGVGGLMPTLFRILVPVVFSPQCEQAIRYAATLACRFQSQLIVLHVVAPPLLMSTPRSYASVLQLESEAARAHFRTQLDEFLQTDLRGLNVRREVLEGEPDQTIVEFARTEECDMIIMPTHGYGIFRRLLLGSVTAKVLHDAGSPVLTGPHLEEPPGGSPSIRTILCAIDLGDQSRSVLDWGSWLAAHFGSRIKVVHVLPPAPRHLKGELEGIYFDSQWLDEVAAVTRRHFDDLQREWDTHYPIQIETGGIPQTLRTVAESAGADLLVIGRGHRRGMLGRLRANAYAILRESPCPVVTI